MYERVRYGAVFSCGWFPPTFDTLPAAIVLNHAGPKPPHEAGATTTVGQPLPDTGL